MATTYWRVTFKAEDGKSRRVWAEAYNDGGGHTPLVRFLVVDRYGEQPEPRELVIADRRDVVKLHRARLSKKYAWLETF